MPTLFVSHSTFDRPFVESQLIPFLNSHGVRTWYSKEAICSGSQWEKAIRDGLQSSEWFLVVVSPQAVSSEWVRCEVDWALTNRPNRVLPLIIGEASADELHLRLRLIQAVDWRASSVDAKKRLLAVLEIQSTNDDGRSTSSRPNVKFDDYLFSRPKNWHCIFCGWKCDDSFNDYMCKQCNNFRPFSGGSSTMVKCRACEGFSLAVAQYCEWCGARIRA